MSIDPRPDMRQPAHAHTGRYPHDTRPTLDDRRPAYEDDALWSTRDRGTATFYTALVAVLAGSLAWCSDPILVRLVALAICLVAAYAAVRNARPHRGEQA